MKKLTVDLPTTYRWEAVHDEFNKGTSRASDTIFVTSPDTPSELDIYYHGEAAPYYVFRWPTTLGRFRIAKLINNYGLSKTAPDFMTISPNSDPTAKDYIRESGASMKAVMTDNCDLIRVDTNEGTLVSHSQRPPKAGRILGLVSELPLQATDVHILEASLPDELRKEAAVIGQDIATLLHHFAFATEARAAVGTPY